LRTLVRYAKRLLIFAGIFFVGILPVFISNTLSYSDGTTVPIDLTGQDSDAADSPAMNELGAVPSELSGQSTKVYPSDIYEAENSGIRQIIKTYELSAASPPDNIPKEGFDNAGWRYEFTDITKKNVTDNVTKEYSVPLSIKTGTKDIDEIISQLAPTLQYFAPDGYSGLLSLDISSIVVEAADEADANPDNEAVDGPVVEPDIDTETEADSSAGTESVEDTSVYKTTAIYTGTLSKMSAEKAVYSVYFTGIKITPTHTPAAPEKQEPPAVHNRPVVTKTVVISSCLSFICCLLLFLVFRGNVKVYNLQEGAYVLLGEARIGFTYPVINLTKFAGKAITGSFVLALNRHISKRTNDKTVTVNYGGKSLQHIVRYVNGEYHIIIDF